MENPEAPRDPKPTALDEYEEAQDYLEAWQESCLALPWPLPRPVPSESS